MRLVPGEGSALGDHRRRGLRQVARCCGPRRPPGFRVLTTARRTGRVRARTAGLHRLLQPLAGRLPSRCGRQQDWYRRRGVQQRHSRCTPRSTGCSANWPTEQPVLVLVDDAGLLDRPLTRGTRVRRPPRHRPPPRRPLRAGSAPRRESSDRTSPAGAAAARRPGGDGTAVRPPPPGPVGGLRRGGPPSRGRQSAGADRAGAGPGELPPDSALRARLRARFHALSPDARQLVLLAVADEDLELDSVVRADLTTRCPGGSTGQRPARSTRRPRRGLDPADPIGTADRGPATTNTGRPMKCSRRCSIRSSTRRAGCGIAAR